MCCFTQEVHVSKTRIFARLAGARQLVAYQMSFEAQGEVAMVLPVPTPAGSAEDAVQFVDLSGYPEIFGDLASAFFVTGASRAAPGSALEDGAANEQLQVHEVGSFDASFVPSPREFLRLDPRFRLSPDVLAALPKYADWGFVVFTLRAPKEGATANAHPMAFSFPTRTPGELFFPCVHVHDGAVHATADFDHQLYAQLEPGQAPMPTSEHLWSRSSGVLAEFADASRSNGVFEALALAFRVEIFGAHPNDDVWVTGAPESKADAETRTISRAREERDRREREIREADLRRSEITGRLLRAVIAAPIAALLGFLVFLAVDSHRGGDDDGLPSALVFSVAWMPALWVFAEAVTGRQRWAWGVMTAASLVVGAGLVVGVR
jgi:hypothetical protein